MPGFANIGDISSAMTDGRLLTCSFRKVPSQASTAGWWVDLSMASGNPQPNYYAATPAVSAVLQGRLGIFHGMDQSPYQKHLKRIGLTTPTAGLVGQYMLLDYLLYYPFIDGDNTAAQVMNDNIDAEDIVTLPRYESGDGVMAMAVAVTPTTGLGQFTFNYINQNGEAKTSPNQFCGQTSSNISNLVTGQQSTVGAVGPFLRLAGGDTGIRSITDVTFSVANGGLICLVLVKPIADSVIREINTTREIEFASHYCGLPRIYDGAYLNLIMNCAASVAAGQLMGYADFIWN